MVTRSLSNQMMLRRALAYPCDVKSALLVTVVASWYLVGLSMTIGLVVYPSFDLVNESRWTAFHRHHVARITWAVGAPWSAQALGLVWWFSRLQHGISVAWWLCAASAAASVAITVTRAVPLHNRLHSVFDPRVAQALRHAHWMRTVCWSLAAAAATAGLSST